MMEKLKTDNNHLIKTAIFAGSFNPFHDGHLNILQKALKIFDHIIVLVANSDEKNNHKSLQARFNQVKAQVKLKRVQVDVLRSGYVADYAKQKNINYLIRSARDCNDFQYELLVAKTNEQINPELQTIILLPDQATKNIRSSQFKD